MVETFETSVNADGYYYSTDTINKSQVHHNGSSKPMHTNLPVNWDSITNRQRIMQGLQKQSRAEMSGFPGGQSGWQER